MKALVFDGALRYVPDHPMPSCRPGEALVRVRLTGVCATDREIMRGYMAFRGIPGHEFVGQVSGPPGSRWHGRRVVAEINCGCGACDRCRAGDPRHCPGRTVLGIAGRDGAFAELVAVPEDRLHPVPDGVPDRAAVFVEPLAAACRILDQVRPLPRRALVVGDGKLGLLVVQVLAPHTEVRLAARHADRARRLVGACAAVREGLPAGERFALVVEASGSPAGLALASAAVEPEGTIVLKSTYAGAPPFDFSHSIVVPEVTLVGSRCGPFAPALALLAGGGIATEPLIEAEYDLADGEAALQHAARPGVLKVLVRTHDLE